MQRAKGVTTTAYHMAQYTQPVMRKHEETWQCISTLSLPLREYLAISRATLICAVLFLDPMYGPRQEVRAERDEVEERRALLKVACSMDLV